MFTYFCANFITNMWNIYFFLVDVTKCCYKSESQQLVIGDISGTSWKKLWRIRISNTKIFETWIRNSALWKILLVLFVICFPKCMQKIVTYPHHYVNTFAWIVERRRCMQQIHTPSFFRFCSSLSYVCAVHDTTLTIAICSGRREADPVLGTGTVSSTLFRPSVLAVLVLRFRLCVRNENSVSLRDRYVRTTTSSRL